MSSASIGRLVVFEQKCQLVGKRGNVFDADGRVRVAQCAVEELRTALEHQIELIEYVSVAWLQLGRYVLVEALDLEPLVRLLLAPLEHVAVERGGHEVLATCVQIGVAGTSGVRSVGDADANHGATARNGAWCDTTNAGYFGLELFHAFVELVLHEVDEYLRAQNETKPFN